MSRCLRILWLLLCLVLAARGSAAAILPITDARWHDHPVAESDALIEQAPLLGLHDVPATEESPNGSLPQPHHHSCHQLCKMLAAAVTAPLPVPLQDSRLSGAAGLLQPCNHASTPRRKCMPRGTRTIAHCVAANVLIW